MKKNSIFCSFFLFCATLTSHANLPTPYDSLEKLLPFNGDGWYFNAAPIEALLKQTEAKIVIELGSWMGASTRHIATLLPKDGLVYAVDHWYTPPYDQNIPYYYAMFDIKNLYNQFLSNVIHAGLTDKIIPIKMSSQTAVELFRDQNIIPDVVYVDGDHEEEAVYADLAAYFPLVKGHGFICGDDWGGGVGFPIKKAVERFSQENNLLIHVTNEMFWLLTEQ